VPPALDRSDPAQINSAQLPCGSAYLDAMDRSLSRRSRMLSPDRTHAFGEWHVETVFPVAGGCITGESRRTAAASKTDTPSLGRKEKLDCAACDPQARSLRSRRARSRVNGFREPHLDGGEGISGRCWPRSQSFPQRRRRPLSGRRRAALWETRVQGTGAWMLSRRDERSRAGACGAVKQARLKREVARKSVIW
jgi:hypothetical protein